MRIGRGAMIGALTMVTAILFSAFLALGFTPSLCASFLKQHEPGEKKQNVVFRTFNRYYEKTSGVYVRHISSAVRHAPKWMLVFVVIVGIINLFIGSASAKWARSCCPRTGRCRIL